MAAREGAHPDVPRRMALKVAVGALCSEAGFGLAEESAIESLVELMQSYITELGRSCQAYAELSGRTEVMCSDVAIALAEMGGDAQSLPAYAKRPNKVFFMPPGMSGNVSQPRTLQAGERQSHHPHIPDCLPIFPDPHTYIQTLTYKKPISEYQQIREKAASQKRDVERALTRFIAKTGETEKLFEDDPYAYPLIACKPTELPYLDALLPKDEDLEAQAEEEKQKNCKQDKQPDDTVKTEKEAPAAAAELAEPAKTTEEENKEAAKSASNESANNNELETDPAIDNPYLRPIKMPRLKGGKSKSKW